jgi:beta-lactamase regulating signal transducer with metallopeptidase domain
MTLLLEMTLQSGLFILLLLALRPFLKKRLPALSRYALWGIPALRLMIPLSFKSMLGLWQHVPAPQIAFPRGETLVAPLPPATPAMPAVEARVLAAAPVTQQAWIPSAQTIVALIWLLGSLAMLLLFIRVNLRFSRSARRAVPVGGIDAPIPVMLVTKDISPCLAGLIRPRILLPGHVLAVPELTDMVILHEVTHYKHKDHLFTALRSLLLILWWWNPLVWLMASLSREDSEAACDEAVTLHMDAHKRETYGMSLIALMQTDLKVSRLLTADTAMSCGKRQMKERIAMIVSAEQLQTQDKSTPSGDFLVSCVQG